MQKVKVGYDKIGKIALEIYETTNSTGNTIKKATHTSLEEAIIDLQSDKSLGLTYSLEMTEAHDERIFNPETKNIDSFPFVVFKAEFNDNFGRKVIKFGGVNAESLTNEIQKQFPVETAEKRAFDRAALRYLGLSGVYSDAEIPDEDSITASSIVEKAEEETPSTPAPVVLEDTEDIKAENAETSSVSDEVDEEFLNEVDKNMEDLEESVEDKPEVVKGTSYPVEEAIKEVVEEKEEISEESANASESEESIDIPDEDVWTSFSNDDEEPVEDIPVDDNYFSPDSDDMFDNMEVSKPEEVVTENTPEPELESEPESIPELDDATKTLGEIKVGIGKYKDKTIADMFKTALKDNNDGKEVRSWIEYIYDKNFENRQELINALKTYGKAIGQDYEK